MFIGYNYCHMFSNTRKILLDTFSERTTAYVFLMMLFFYIVVSGIFRFKNLVAIPLDIQALVILIPIFFTDIIKTMYESFGKKSLYKAREDISKVTVVIPTMNGASTIGMTIENLLRKFHSSSIVVISNGSSDDTVAVAKSYNVPVIDIATPIGKVEAINRGLHMVMTPYVLILDDDTLLDNAVIPTNALDAGYVGVAFRVFPIRKGWLSTVQSHEYRKSMDIGRGFQSTTGTVLSISGAIGLFYTKELLRQITQHTGEFSGEDLQRTLLVHLEKENKGVVLADSIVRTDVPGTIGSLFRQRAFGWYPGQYANMFIYLKLLLRRRTPFKLKLESFFTIFIITALDPIRLVALPVLLFTPAYMIIFYLTYVISETVPYMMMGRQEPYWVILLSPFYGLFDFLCRITAGSVFLYRRIAVKFARANRLDDYKIVSFSHRAFAVGVSSFLITTSLTGYTYMDIVPSDIRTNYTNAIISLTKPEIADKLVTPVAKTPAHAKDYTYTVLSGDSLWKISQKIVDAYCADQKLMISPAQRNTMISYLVTLSADKVIKPGEEYIFRKVVLDDAYASRQEVALL